MIAPPQPPGDLAQKKTIYTLKKAGRDSKRLYYIAKMVHIPPET